MKEKDFQKKFSRWLRYNNHQSAVYELKLARGNSIPFSAVKPHQIEALLHAESSFIVYKIPDDTIGQKPFDCFKLVKVPGYTVFMFDNSPNCFYLIEIKKFIKEASLNIRKSLTEAKANEIGIRCHFDVIEN